MRHRRALAPELAGRGSEVVIADRQIQLAKQIAGSLRDRGGQAHAAEVDVRSFDARRQGVMGTT